MLIPELFDGILNAMSGFAATFSRYLFKLVWTITAHDHLDLYLFIIKTEFVFSKGHGCELEAPPIQVSLNSNTSDQSKQRQVRSVLSEGLDGVPVFSNH